MKKKKNNKESIQILFTFDKDGVYVDLLHNSKVIATFFNLLTNSDYMISILDTFLNKSICLSGNKNIHNIFNIYNRDEDDIDKQ